MENKLERRRQIIEIVYDEEFHTSKSEKVQKLVDLCDKQSIGARIELVNRMYKSWEDNSWDSVEEFFDYYKGYIERKSAPIKGDKNE
jgi:hypothetical protein